MRYFSCARLFVAGSQSKMKNDVCSPLDSYNDVLSWNCDNNSCWAEKVRKIYQRTKYCYWSSYGRDKSTQSDSSLLPSVKLRSDKVPKTLVCHDMKGGYLEDRFVEDTVATDPYRFFHWPSIDIFVYFSHHFVTIPPVGWINASHLHGVPILGTVITEGETGLNICESILESKERVHVFSRKLADICQHYGFDGYLLNIENKIDEKLIFDLVNFVKILKEDLKTVCSDRNTWVIWYDSVIIPTGELKWQNKLNQHNRSFFDACDGIFLNYCWNEEDLKESLECAGLRMEDVYVGIDVFGRNCYGGGGFNTDQALKVIRNYGLSTAIFAPGWTHELQSKEEGDDFMKREYIFWKKLYSFLYLHGPSTLPFRTSFCQGFGEMLFKEGDVCEETPWFNLRKQNYQPSCITCMHSDKDSTGSQISCISLHTDDAYEGGSCLRISSCGEENNRLLVCNFTGNSGDRLYYITIAYQFVQDDGQFTLTLLMEEKDMLETMDDKTSSQSSAQVSDGRVTLTAVGFRQSGPNMLHLENFIQANQDYPNGWKKRTFKLTHEGEMSITEMFVKTSPNCAVLLGLLEITSGK